jgi:DNA-binding transcriptional LysR family regulator
MPSASERPSLRVGKVPGVTVTKWRGIWAERFPRVRLEVIDVDEQDQRRVLTDGQVELCFVRLPIDDDGLHLIRLYDELPVAWVSKDHLVAAADEVSLADLADETVLSVVTPHSIDLVAIGEAVLHVPQSIARSQSRRDFVYRPITDAPHTTVGLAWLVDNPNELIEEFIGIVRGRTTNSSRTAQTRVGKGQTKG